MKIRTEISDIPVEYMDYLNSEVELGCEEIWLECDGDRVFIWREL